MSTIKWITSPGSTVLTNPTPQLGTKLTVTKEKSTLVRILQIPGFAAGVWKTFVPALYSPDKIYPEFSLEQPEVEELEGDVAQITLTYSVDSQQSNGIPASTISETASEVQISIKQHPKYPDWVAAGLIDASTGLFSVSSGKYGEDYYIVGSKEVVFTQYYDGDPGESVLDGIGYIVTNMPGGYDGSNNNWLLTNATKSQQGQYWALVQNIRYSSRPWDSDIYTQGT